ncbi:hypothetical protein C8J57DRAFT_1060463 [Mycena rebaudengoi]|nr:hypothetical protein C8J57DRAFT_1060463 [Mycena rebaudengoi]
MPALFNTAARHELTPIGVNTHPCTGLDMLVPFMVLTNGFVIDAQLDVKILEQTLCTLVEHRFPRAGARPAVRNGAYEFQIPQRFDADTRPIAFTAQEYPEQYLLSSHGLKLPVRTPNTPYPSICKYLLWIKECPTSLSAFLSPNTPLVHVHVSTFDDLTFIGVTSSHATFEALGMQTLLHAWTRLINGDALDMIEGMKWDTAPFDPFTKVPVTKPPRGWFEFGLIKRFLCVAHQSLRILRDPTETEETRVVRMPKEFLKDAKHHIINELRLKGSNEWVGSSNVLTAWWLKAVYGHRKDITPVHIHIAIDLRDQPVFAGESALATPYINNAYWMIPLAPLPANLFRTEPLSGLAIRIRRAILSYNENPIGITADLTWICSNVQKVLFPCSPHGEMTALSNWRKARISALDFSGASIGSGAHACVVQCLVETMSPHPLRRSGFVLMEDEESVWLSQIRGVKEWEKIRRSGSVAFITVPVKYGPGETPGHLPLGPLRGVQLSCFLLVLGTVISQPHVRKGAGGTGRDTCIKILQFLVYFCSG